jgi:hypothetical protein
VTGEAVRNWAGRTRRVRSADVGEVVLLRVAELRLLPPHVVDGDRQAPLRRHSPILSFPKLSAQLLCTCRFRGTDRTASHRSAPRHLFD